MASVYRLAIAAFLAAIGFSALAAGPVPWYRLSSSDTAQWRPTVAAACVDALALSQLGDDADSKSVSVAPVGDPPACQIERSFMGKPVRPMTVSLDSQLRCPQDYTLVNGDCKPPPGQCIANAERVNGECQCKVGFKKDEGQCKPNNLCTELAGKPLGVPVNFDYGSRGVGALGRMVGKPTMGCYPGGCTVSGTVDGCWAASGGGGSGCKIVSPSFTGDKCDDKNPNQGCPDGSSPSAYAAGVCIPDESKCPAGSSESKYAAGVCIPDENPCPAGRSPSKYAQGVCVPNESNDADGNGEQGKPSNCPAGRVPSKYASGVCIPADSTVGGGSGGGTGGGTTTCKDGKCTTTKPDGSTEEKPESEFCKANPDASICKKGSFGGSCGSWTCDGDAIQCAIAKEQHRQNCKLFDEKTPDLDYKKAVDGSDEKSADSLRKTAEKVSVSQLDTNGLGWGRTCPADLSFEVAGKSFAIPFSKVCPILNVMALAALGLTLLSSVLWVVGKKD